MPISIRWHKNISVQMQNEFDDFVDTTYKNHQIYFAFGQKCFYAIGLK